MDDTMPVYEIRLHGHIDARRARQFAGLSVTLLPTGETLLTGPIVDQAALHGILARIRDTGLPLLEVRQISAAPESSQ